MQNFKNKLRAFVRGENASSLALTAVVLAVAVVLNVLLYVLDVNYGLYFRAEDDEDYTVSDAAADRFAEAEREGKEVTILFCRAEDDVSTHATGAYVYETARQLAEKYPDFIRLDFVNIITWKRADGSDAGDIAAFKGNIGRNSVIFLCGENSKIVTDTRSSAGYADFFALDSSGSAIAYKGEEVMTGMIEWVLNDLHPKAYITIGHGERVDSEFYAMLACAGYEAETLDLKNREVPEDAGLVLISSPVSDFEVAEEGSTIRSEIARLTDYYERGGSIYAAMDPYVKRLSNLETFFSRYGITVAREKSDGSSSVRILRDRQNAISTDGYFFMAEIDAATATGRAAADVLAAFDDGAVMIGNAAELSLSDGASALLTTSRAGEVYASGERVDSSGRYAAAALATFEGTGEYRGKTGRLFVIAASSFSSSDLLNTDGYANKDMIYALFDSFFGSQTPPYGAAVLTVGSSTLEHLTMREARLYTALLLALPVALAICGAVLTLRRKNR